MKKATILVFALALFMGAFAGTEVINIATCEFNLHEYINNQYPNYFYIRNIPNGNYYVYYISPINVRTNVNYLGDSELRRQGIAKSFLAMIMFAHTSGKNITIEYQDNATVGMERIIISIYVN
jgi:hypothetical protein